MSLSGSPIAEAEDQEEEIIMKSLSIVGDDEGKGGGDARRFSKDEEEEIIEEFLSNLEDEGKGGENEDLFTDAEDRLSATGMEQNNEHFLPCKTPQISVRQGNSSSSKAPGNTEDEPEFENAGTVQENFEIRCKKLQQSLVRECLIFLNTANKNELQILKHIGEKKAQRIVEEREKHKELFTNREKHEELFTSIYDIKDVLILSKKEVIEMITHAQGDFFLMEG